MHPKRVNIGDLMRFESGLKKEWIKSADPGSTILACYEARPMVANLRKCGEEGTRGRNKLALLRVVELDL